MLKTFLCLRIKEVEVKKDTEDINKPKKFMTFKEKRKTLSRMQRKVWFLLFFFSFKYSVIISVRLMS